MERKNLLSGANNYKGKRSKTLATYDDFIQAVKGFFVPFIDVFTKEHYLVKRLSDPEDVGRVSFSLGLVKLEEYLIQRS